MPAVSVAEVLANPPPPPARVEVRQRCGVWYLRVWWRVSGLPVSTRWKLTESQLARVPAGIPVQPELLSERASASKGKKKGRTGDAAALPAGGGDD